MADIIQLLPDSVANQIAAGEVIQRPASVVKELVENSIDSGATSVKINVKDAGRTLIQVIDNGCGMSDTDLRMAFERHATSKIKVANDLFAVRTMGFRGEALASIAAVAEVEVKSRLLDADVGSQLLISGSKVISQDPVSSNGGTNICVKNLFFNVPARRKFLKSNSTELRHIMNEFQRIALAYPDIALALYHNDSPVYDLPSENLKRRIVNIFGKTMNNKLIPVEVDTSLVKITGYIGQPKFAKKRMGEQFFFVNNRYMKHPSFHKAVMQAYNKIIAPETIPSYFLRFDVDPESIDINIHPTKTEIKFEDESAIWQFLIAAMRESLGKHNEVPSIDFDQAGSIDIPVALEKGEQVDRPQIEVNTKFNPFEEEKRLDSSDFSSWNRDVPPNNWETLYQGAGAQQQPQQEYITPSEEGFLPQGVEGFMTQGSEGFASHGGEEQFYQSQMEAEPVQQTFESKIGTESDTLRVNHFLQFKNKYILSAVKSGLMVIDQRRAHIRILYERFMDILQQDGVASQQELFPQSLELDFADAEMLKEIMPDLRDLGFDIREFGPNAFVVNGTPGMLGNVDPGSIIQSFLEEYKSSGSGEAKDRVREEVAKSLAVASAINYGTQLENEEIQELIDSLFACSSPNYSPSGKPVISILPLGDIEKMFQ
ncbi:DNA mismatch repair endonuclease MutL [Puteibacter caeruleilacunae]|nr:DNA mismatch repair endonuclease MutL [Puteibacter caeruleilacunae]